MSEKLSTHPVETYLGQLSYMAFIVFNGLLLSLVVRTYTLELFRFTPRSALEEFLQFFHGIAECLEKGCLLTLRHPAYEAARLVCEEKWPSRRGAAQLPPGDCLAFERPHNERELLTQLVRFVEKLDPTASHTITADEEPTFALLIAFLGKLQALRVDQFDHCHG